jgi:hypothetical protein
MFSVPLAAGEIPQTCFCEGALLITTVAFGILKRLRASHLAFGHVRCVAGTSFFLNTLGLDNRGSDRRGCHCSLTFVQRTIFYV